MGVAGDGARPAGTVARGVRGLGGVRDEALLDSALNRPQQLFHHDKPGLFELAAAYASGLVRNHPFLDGNKRTGFTTAIVFLEINGYDFIGAEARTVKTLALAARELGRSRICPLAEVNSRKS